MSQLKAAHAVFDGLSELLNVLQKPGIFGGDLTVLVDVLAVLGGEGDQTIGVINHALLTLSRLSAPVCFLQLLGFHFAHTAAECSAVGCIVRSAAALCRNGPKLSMEVYAAGAKQAQGGTYKRYAAKKRSQDSLL